MAHYAVIDENNIVINIISGRDEDEVVEGISDWEAFYSDEIGMRCVRTSINTYKNVHALGGAPFRYNFATIGGRYDEEHDGFIAPKPFSCDGRKWILDPDTLSWELEQPYPDDGYGYVWDTVVETWSRKGPKVPIPDSSKNWYFDDETMEWVEDIIEIVE